MTALTNVPKMKPNAVFNKSRKKSVNYTPRPSPLLLPRSSIRDDQYDDEQHYERQILLNHVLFRRRRSPFNRVYPSLENTNICEVRAPFRTFRCIIGRYHTVKKVENAPALIHFLQNRRTHRLSHVHENVEVVRPKNPLSALFFLQPRMSQ